MQKYALVFLFMQNHNHIEYTRVILLAKVGQTDPLPFRIEASLRGRHT